MRGWRYQTRRGPIFIRPHQGRWIVVYDDENLGSYHSPNAAADDVAGGHISSPSNGVDFADLEVPDHVGEWEAL